MGTAEDAQILNQWKMQGQGPSTTEQLLDQIFQVQQPLLQVARQ